MASNLLGKLRDSCNSKEQLILSVNAAAPEERTAGEQFVTGREDRVIQ
jgi:hypothetical protein